MERVEDVHDLLTGLRIQRAGRFVGKQQLRPRADRPRDRHALALSAGKLRGIEVHAVLEPDLQKRLFRAFAAFALRHVAVHQRQSDVFPCPAALQKMERLKHEADLFVADACHLGVGRTAVVRFLKVICAFCGRIEIPEDVHQRRLSGAGRSHDCIVLAFVHGKIDVVQYRDGMVGGAVCFFDMFETNQHFTLRTIRYLRRPRRNR